MEAAMNFGWNTPLGGRQQNFARAFGFGPSPEGEAERDERRGPRGGGRERRTDKQRGRQQWHGPMLNEDTDPRDPGEGPGRPRGEGRPGRGHGPHGGGRGRGPRGGGFGPDFPWAGRPGGPGHFGGRGRARRGDVRLAALLLIAEEPRNGYQIISELAERTQGAWKPSPGAIYPALSQLEDEGLIAPVQAEGRKAFEITEAGRTEVESRGDRPAPWAEVTGEQPDSTADLMVAMRDLGMAVRAVASTGDQTLTAQAAEQLDQAKKALYALLAGH